MPTDVIPADNDTATASAARIYDCYLNGTSPHPADSQAAGQVLAAVPDAPKLARASQAFTLRATRLMGRRGISQFLSVGCGLATQPSIHDAARPSAPAPGSCTPSMTTT